MKYVQKVSNAGTLFKVNRIDGNYSVYIDNKPILNSMSKWKTTLHDLQRVIFIGSLFNQSLSSETDVAFFYVSKRQILIPFRLANSSDIRHLKLPARFSFDLLPASVFFFQDLNIGSYANALKTGVQYFILEPNFSRDLIVNLKYNFPLSRVIIYQENKNLELPGQKKKDESKFYEEGEAIDFELIDRNEIALLSRDVLFSARILISKKQWDSLLTLPFKLLVSPVECQLILFYLKPEIHIEELKNRDDANNDNNDNNDAMLKLKQINKLYEALMNFLSLKKRKVKSYLDKTIFDTELIDRVEKVIALKKTGLDYVSQKDEQERSFYDYVLLELKEKKMKIEESFF